MNGAHLHLILNHIPVMGLLFGLVFLVVALIGRNKTLIKASLWILVLVAIMSIPAYLTGDAAEEIVEGMPGISSELIHEHEESAEKAFIAILALGVVAALGLVVHRAKNRVSGMFLATIFLLMIITGVLLGSAANMGGKIRHSEIRTEGAFPSSAAQPDQFETDDDD